MQKRLSSLWRRKSLFSIVLCGCLLVLLAPITLMSVSYVISQNGLREQMLQVQELTLQRVRTLADSSLQEISAQMAMMAAEDATVELARYGSEATPLRARALASYQKNLLLKEQNLPFSASIAAYFEKSRLLVTSEGIVKEAAFAWYAGQKGTDAAAFESVLNPARYRDFKILNQGTNDCKMVLTQKIYEKNSRKPIGTVFSLVSCAKTVAALEKSVVHMGETLCLENAEGSLGEIRLEDEKGWQRSSARSNDFDLVYTCYAQEAMIFAPLNNQGVVLIALWALALIMGLSLALAFLHIARQQTEPLFKLLIQSPSQERYRPALGSLLAAAEQFCRDREEMLLIRSKDEHSSFRNQLMIALKDEQLVLEGWATVLTESGLAPDGRYYVALFRGQGVGELYEALTLCERARRGVAMKSGNECMLLIGEGGEPDKEAARALENRSKISCAVSREACGIGELAKVYGEAARVLAFHDFWDRDGQRVNVFGSDADDEIAGDAKRQKAIMTDACEKIVNAIHAGDYHTAHQLTDNALGTLFERKIATLDMDICIFHGLIAVILQALAHHVPQQDVPFVGQLNIDGVLTNAQSFAEICDALDALFRDLAFYQQNRKSSTQPYIDKINAEIEKSYADPDFSISKLADQYGYNASYLSHYYKKYTGIGILDRLHQKRIREAQTILKQGRSVREAAELTGYTDSRALIRSFKRYVGITPGQYGK